MTDNEKNLELLMTLSQGGDTRAYTLLLQETARFVRPFLAQRLALPSALDDLLQEVLISVHKARHTYDAGRPYKPWVYAIARFRLLDFLRTHYADQLVQADEWSEATHDLSEPVTEPDPRYESISEELCKLPEKPATILRLMHHDGLTAKEVAQKMGMTESAVKVAAHRAYKLLRKTVQR